MSSVYDYSQFYEYKVRTIRKEKRKKKLNSEIKMDLLGHSHVGLGKPKPATIVAQSGRANRPNIR